MDAMNDILRSFRTEYRKTPVKLKVCHYDLLDVRDCTTTFVILQVLDCFLVYTLCTGLIQVRFVCSWLAVHSVTFVTLLH